MSELETISQFFLSEPWVRPKIVVICGSSRFIDVMAVCGWFIERDEKKIVVGLHLLPTFYNAAKDHIAEAENVAAEMDKLHLRKIDLADEVFVVNVDNYIGVSTTWAVLYAQSLGKPVRWFTHDPIGKLFLERFEDIPGLKREGA